MNVTVLFLLIPIAFVIPALFTPASRYRTFTFISSIFFFLLSFAALFLPLDQPLNLLGYSVSISHVFSVLNREFIFTPQVRFIIFLVIFTIAANLFFSFIFPSDRLLLPFVLVSLSLFSASVFIQPLLFAVFFWFFLVCLFSIWLYFSSAFAYRASVRLLVFSLVGGFLLILSIPLLATDPNAADTAKSLNAGVYLFCIGALMLLSIPPMHFWQLDAIDRAPAYSFFFFYSLVSVFTFFLLFRFINEFELLRSSVFLFQGIQILGASLCVFGALFSLFQEKITRIFIYLSYINFGSILLAFSIHSAEGISVVFILLACRLFLFLLCAIAFQLISEAFRNAPTASTKGLFYRMPLASISVLISLLGLVGFPGLLSFPGIWATLRLLSLQSDTARISEVILLLSILIVTLSVFQQASVFFSADKEKLPEQKENRVVQAVLVSIILVFIITSFFPQIYIPWISDNSKGIFNL